MHNEYIKVKKASELLRIAPNTLRKWDKEGKISSIRTPSNIRRFNIKDIQNIISGSTVNSEEQEKERICYCRVSSQKQMDDLNRQKDFFKHKFPNHKLVTDVGSGINWKRKGLKTILEQTMSRNISEVVVAHRDRLCRFAFELLEWIFRKNGVKLLVLNEAKDQSHNTELSDDIMSIIHVYSCRQMGKRRYKVQENENLSNKNSEGANQ